MTLEFEPKSLEGVINGPYAEKRLKNRDGVALITNNQGKTTILDEGPLLGVHETAVDYDQNHPSQTVTIVEGSCGTNIVPVFDQFQVE